jgi:hypothetical protein
LWQTLSAGGRENRRFIAAEEQRRQGAAKMRRQGAANMRRQGAGGAKMRMRGLGLALAGVVALALAGCSGGREPNDAIGAKVLRNLLSKQGVGGKLISFRKTDGRALKTPSAEAYELWYEAEVQFPEAYEANCADERSRGRCAYLGLAQNQSFQKGEVLKAEGTLHFVRSDKGWVGEDASAY